MAGRGSEQLYFKGGIMRGLSPLSDPVAAGINAYSTMTKTLEDQDTAPLKKELMASEIADRRLRQEKTRGDIDESNKRRDMYGKMGDYMSELAALDQKDHANPSSVGNYSDGEQTTLAKAVVDAHLLPGNNVSNIDQKKASIEKLGQFWQKNPQIVEKGGIVDFEKIPEAGAAFKDTFEDVLNKQGRQTKYGGVGENGISQTPVRIIVDPKTKTITPVVKVTQPVEEGQTFQHIQKDGTDHVYMAPSAPTPTGLVGQGTIDLSKRPVVGHEDGSVSTVLSMSINEDGAEVLIPKISPDGKVLSNEGAVALYHKTGQHLGKFDSSEHADQYAMQLHNDPMWQDDMQTYGVPRGTKERSYENAVTMGGSTSPNAPVAQIPIGMMQQQLKAHHDLYTKIAAMRAKLDPMGTWTEFQKKIDTEANNRAASDAMAGVDKKATVSERRQQFITSFMKSSPTASIKDASEMAKTLIADRKPGQMKPYTDKQGNIKHLDTTDPEQMAESDEKGLTPFKEAAAKEHQERHYQKGGTEIYEESNDGGKTWKELGRGPKFSKEVAGVDGKGKIDKGDIEDKVVSVSDYMEEKYNKDDDTPADFHSSPEIKMIDKEVRKMAAAGKSEKELQAYVDKQLGKQAKKAEGTNKKKNTDNKSWDNSLIGGFTNPREMGRKLGLNKDKSLDEAQTEEKAGKKDIKANTKQGQGSEPPVKGAKQAKDGKWYIPDPKRPGKYLRVES